MKKLTRNFAGLALVIGFLAVTASCGGGGGGGSDGSSSSIAGNVSSVSTARSESNPASWIVRLAAEAVGFVRTAYAQVAGIAGVEVSAGGENDETDSGGNFDLPNAPTGNVTVTFRNGDCEADVALPDVAEDSTIRLDDVDLDCDEANPAKIAESFEAIVRSVPNSPNGNLTVCVDLGSGFRNRAVKIKNAEFEGGTFEDLAVEDRIAVAGVREGQGAPSALDADVVTLLGPSGGDPCDGDVLPTQTPDATETPDGSQTPEPTVEPTPTATQTELP